MILITYYIQLELCTQCVDNLMFSVLLLHLLYFCTRHFFCDFSSICMFLIKQLRFEGLV